MPEKNKEYWAPKIARNKKRDREVDSLLKAQNYIPIRIWEHDLRKDLRAARRKIRRVIREYKNMLISEKHG